MELQFLQMALQKFEFLNMKSEPQICEDLYSRHMRFCGYEIPLVRKIVEQVREHSLANSLWTKNGNLTFYSQGGENALRNEILKKVSSTC